MDDDHYDKLYKIILIGDSSVGKTNILSRYVSNDFTYESKCTIGVEFATNTLNLDDNVIKIQIWDTAGQERFRSITRAYYRSTDGIIIVYDITNRKSLNNVKYWMNEIHQNSSDGTVRALVGNKSDLSSLRQVSTEEGIYVANEYGLCFMETSALDGNNINKLFQELAQNIYDRQFKDPEIDTQDKRTEYTLTGNVIYNDLVKSPKNKRCCK